MGYNRTSYDAVEPRAPGMYFLRDALGCSDLGVTVLEAKPGWEGREHDHNEDDHEEVYLLVSGHVTLTVDGDDLELSSGDAVRVDPASTRQLTFDEKSTMVIAGGP